MYYISIIRCNKISDVNHDLFAWSDWVGYYNYYVFLFLAALVNSYSIQVNFRASSPYVKRMCGLLRLLQTSESRCGLHLCRITIYIQ